MSKFFPSSDFAQARWRFLLGLLSLSIASCSQQSFSPRPTVTPVSQPATTNQPVQSSSTAPSVKASPKVDTYQLALDRAASAYKISQSAQSQDDWRLVVNRWRQAIDLMKSVPASNPHHSQAKQKLTEYQQRLAQAQRQANRSTQAANPDGVILLPSQAKSTSPVPPVSPVSIPSPVPIAAAPAQSAQPAQPTQPSQARIFSAPIIRREGNTPVVRVNFNGSKAFDMIVDTGASGTLITRQMANALGVVPIAQANVDTASQKGVAFPLGYVQSIEVGGAQASNVMVAIAGPGLDVGLLGHDFFGHYDVTIREKEVEFRERT